MQDGNVILVRRPAGGDSEKKLMAPQADCCCSSPMAPHDGDKQPARTLPPLVLPWVKVTARCVWKVDPECHSGVVVAAMAVARLQVT